MSQTETTSVERRLAAILAADVVGYSRLMEVDEAGTLARLKTIRLELIDPAIAKCKGRIIKTTGDGMLVEFQSVTEALRCAVDFQERMARRNRDMPASRILVYRIGLNLGDVIAEGDDIFGDGVNIAARLESIAEPGGICISAAVRDQVGDRLEVAYQDLGEQQVKNISRPIRIFKVVLNGDAAAASDPASARPAAAAPAASPRKPSIAVLPFANMSGDSEQEFFADGLTEDIITELSRFRELLVISRNAVFVHKGKPVKAQEIAREFGVEYVVEGSVRKAADRVRVTVQLIDGETETHVWAERYDRKLADIFEIQDEVTSSIAATLFGRVEAARHDRVQRKRTDNMAAYEYVLTGKVLHHWSNREANAQALAHARSRHRAGPELRACARLEGVRDRPGVAARLVREPRRHAGGDIGRAANRALARRQRRRRASNPCGPEAELQRARQGDLSSGTRAEPQSEQRPHRRAAG